MKSPQAHRASLVAFAITATLSATAGAGTTVQIGATGKTFASSAVQCIADPAGGYRPAVDAGLFNAKNGTTAAVSLDGTLVAQVSSNDPSTRVWMTSGSHSVVVALNRKTADRYVFSVSPTQCALPDTSLNTFSPDGTLEYGASRKSYATVTPGCALNGATGQTQPYVHLFDNGGFLLNVSVNGVPLTQLSSLKTHVPVFLGAGPNVIAAANGSLSTDYYVRDGGDGRCVLNP